MNTEDLSKISEEIKRQERNQIKRFSIYTLLMIAIALTIGGWSVYEGFRAAKLQTQIELNEKKIDSLENRIQKASSRLAEQQEKILNNYSINSHIKIGLENFYSNHFDLAIREYDEAIKLDTANYVLYDFSGYAYYKLKNYKKAIELLKKSIQLNSSYSWGYYNLGLVYWMSGDKTKARETFKILLSKDRSFIQIMMNDFQFQEILKDIEMKEMLK